eukprot:scaffold4450_cov113-Isochrysis_galbana.AAC.11
MACARMRAGRVATPKRALLCAGSAAEAAAEGDPHAIAGVVRPAFSRSAAYDAAGCGGWLKMRASNADPLEGAAFLVARRLDVEGRVNVALEKGGGGCEKVRGFAAAPALLARCMGRLKRERALPLAARARRPPSSSLAGDAFDAVDTRG